MNTSWSHTLSGGVVRLLLPSIPNFPVPCASRPLTRRSVAFCCGGLAGQKKLAYAVWFLASQYAHYIRGQILQATVMILVLMCLIWLFVSRELCLLLDLMGSLRLLSRWGIELTARGS